ncbi:hypothetical protein [Nostoc sp.]|uniref:hypothetical protein n=1 Tax=Nostoc sp. TaxID=1180 RepID=UPI002FFB8A19
MAKPPSKRKKATSAASRNLKATASSAEDTFDPENPATATITVTAAEVEEEQSDRLHLEERSQPTSSVIRAVLEPHLSGRRQ